MSVKATVGTIITHLNADGICTKDKYGEVVPARLGSYAPRNLQAECITHERQPLSPFLNPQ